MSEGRILDIEAVVHDCEKPAVAAAMEQLLESLQAASSLSWSIRIGHRDHLQAVDTSRRPHVVITSMVRDAAGIDEPFEAAEARWRAGLERLTEAEIPAILVGTIFRHVPNRTNRAGQNDRILERIRRLNLLAIELSHDLGIGVVDFDRAFAHIGARTLDTDYRLRGRLAAEVAGHTIVAGILARGLDDLVSPEIQERARQFQGDILQMEGFLRRRLSADRRSGQWT